MEYYKKHFEEYIKVIDQLFIHINGIYTLVPRGVLIKIIIYMLEDDGKTPMKLKQWIPREILKCKGILLNPNAGFMMLKRNTEIILQRDIWNNSNIFFIKSLITCYGYNIHYIKYNVNILDLCEDGYINDDLYHIYKNPCIFHLLNKKYQKKYIKKNLTNPRAVPLLNKYYLNSKVSEKIYENPGLVPYINVWVKKHFRDYCRSFYDNLKQKNLSCILSEQNFHHLFDNEYPDEIYYNIEILNLYKNCSLYYDMKKYLSSNIDAVSYLIRHPELISWDYLSANPNAVEYLKENLDMVDWFNLCSNTEAINILDEIVLSYEHSEEDMTVLFKQIFSFAYLCENENALHLVKKGMKYFSDARFKIEFLDNLSKNPSIFEVDEGAVKDLLLMHI